MIFEVITSASAPHLPPKTVIPTSAASKKKKAANADEDVSDYIGIGSICGGGRYDELVGRFAGESRQIPCVGMSVGIERVFAILKAKYASNGRASETQVYVVAIGNVTVEERLAIMKELWDAGIKVLILLRMIAYKSRNFSIKLDRRISQNSSSWLKRLRLLFPLLLERRKSLQERSRSNNLEQWWLVQKAR